MQVCISHKTALSYDPLAQFLQSKFWISWQLNSFNCLTSNISSSPIIHQQVNMLVFVWKSNMHQWQETHYSLSLITFYDLIFCLIDFSSRSLSYSFSHCLPPPNTTQRCRQLRQLVNSDKEAESTSHTDIYRVIFTTSLYNLCPFTPFLYFVSSHARKLDGNFYMSSLTGRGHRSQSQQFAICACECEVWGV